MSSVRITEGVIIPGYYTPNQKDKVEIGSILRDIVSNTTTIHGQSIPKIFEVSTLSTGKSQIFTTAKFRLDFQGRTTNRGYNFQIQTNERQSKTVAAVIIDQQSFEQVQDKGKPLYIARQISGAFQYSLGNQHIYNIQYVASLEEMSVLLGKTPVEEWNNNIDITSYFHSDTLNKLKEGSLLDCSINESNKKLRTTLSDSSTFASVDYEYLGATVDITKINPFDLGSSISTYNVLSFSDGPTRDIPNGVAFRARPSAQLTYSVSTLTNSHEVSNEVKNSVSAGVDGSEFGFSASVEFDNIHKMVNEQSNILTSSNVIVNIGEARIQDGIHLPFNTEFKYEIGILNYNDADSINTFVTKYGTHYINSFDAGGVGKQYVRFSSSTLETLAENKSTFSAEAKIFFFKSSFSHSSDDVINDKTGSSVTSGTVVILGGVDLPSPPDPSQPGSLVDFSQWAKSVYDQSVPLNISLARYDELLTKENFPKDKDIDNKRLAIKSAIDSYLNSHKDTFDTNPLVSGDEFIFSSIENNNIVYYSPDMNFQENQDNYNFVFQTINKSGTSFWHEEDLYLNRFVRKQNIDNDTLYMYSYPSNSLQKGVNMEFSDLGDNKYFNIFFYAEEIDSQRNIGLEITPAFPIFCTNGDEKIVHTKEMDIPNLYKTAIFPSCQSGEFAYIDNYADAIFVKVPALISSIEGQTDNNLYAGSYFVMKDKVLGAFFNGNVADPSIDFDKAKIYRLIRKKS